MRFTKLTLLMPLAAAFFQVNSESAFAASPVNVACSPSKKLQSSIDAAPPASSTVLVVSGTCNENITVPKGKIITIRGANTNAKITPANAALPAILVQGDAIIQSIAVLNPSGSADSVVSAERGSYLEILASKISGTSAGNVVTYWYGAGGRISNSRITGGQYGAVEVWDGGALEVVGSPTEALGPDGFKTYISSEADAVACGIGGSLIMWAKADGAKGGAIEIKGKYTGVYGRQCSMRLTNSTNSAANFSISGIQSGGSAIYADQSSLSVKNLSITANDFGISVSQSSVSVDGTSFAKNVVGDIGAAYNSSVRFVGWNKPNSLPQAFSNNVMNCYPEGKSDIFIGYSSIEEPSGKSIEDLVTNNPCVTIEY